MMNVKTALSHLGRMVDEKSKSPDRDYRLMARNLKLGIKLTKRVVTKVLLKNLHKFGIGTREVETTARAIATKEKKRKRNVSDVRMLLKRRSNDAEKEERKARYEYKVDKDNLKKQIKEKIGIQE